MSEVRNIKYDRRNKILIFDLIIHKEDIPPKTYKKMYADLRVLDRTVDLIYDGCKAPLKGPYNLKD